MKRLYAFSVCVALIGLTVASTCAAKPKPKKLQSEAPTGSFIRVDPITFSDRERNRAIVAFARCIVQRTNSKVDHFLRHSDSLGIDPKLGEIKDFLPMSDCLRDSTGAFEQLQATFSSRDIRSWLAEQAYLQAYPSFIELPSNLPAVPSRAYFSVDPFLPIATRVGEFSDCLVARNASGADAVLRSERGSPAERVATQALALALGACVIAGNKMAFSPPAIRAYAADGLWQRYEAGKPPAYKGRK